MCFPFSHSSRNNRDQIEFLLHGKDLHKSFPAVVGRDPRTLILGSMPGVASLDAQQYYAHPRNAFWPIMGKLFGAGPDKPYAERLQLLTTNGIALWDVLASCERKGSLDSAIIHETPNDFEGFFASRLHIRRILLNGGKAALSFRKHAARHAPKGALIVPLPSTSPAHAARRFDEKCAAWRAGFCVHPK